MKSRPIPPYSGGRWGAHRPSSLTFALISSRSACSGGGSARVLLGELRSAPGPPQHLLVGQDLVVDEVGRPQADVVDGGVESGNRRHVDRHRGLLGRGWALAPSWPSPPARASPARQPRICDEGRPPEPPATDERVLCRAMSRPEITHARLTLDRRTLDEAAVLGARSFFDDPFFVHLSGEPMTAGPRLTLYIRSHLAVLARRRRFHRRPRHGGHTGRDLRLAAAGHLPAVRGQAGP